MEKLWHQWKYLIAYLIPVSALLAVGLGGSWSWSTVIIAFVIIPLGESLIGGHGGNLSPDQERADQLNRIFDFLLYLNLPLLWAIIVTYAWQCAQGIDSWGEWAGMTLSAGIAAGASGINVAHELGHRENPLDQWMARLLLLPELYQHFTIEHNYGHHKNIATPLDPATARKGETIYAFWWRSISGSYAGAWKIERDQLKRQGIPFWSPRNRMLLFTIMPLLYLGDMAWWLGIAVLLPLLAVAAVGVLLLETINYIEHYGLLRKQLDSGRYEPVNISHSWNSNHELGRIFLYELTRHADHHDKANRKYPVLRHFDESPQLPLGYPASILLALVPPLWFAVMDPRVPSPQSLETV